MGGALAPPTDNCVWGETKTTGLTWCGVVQCGEVEVEGRVW